MLKDYSKFTVVIPTLNEKDTITEILGIITKRYPGIRVLVVDDGSTDGTQEAVKEKSKGNGAVKIIDRHSEGLQRGLTASIADGMLESKTPYVIVIDADMQHPPEKIGDLAANLAAGYDLAVANRERVTKWAAYRKAISRFFMYSGKILLYFNAKETCVDTFSGFFGVRRDLFLDVYKKNKSRFVPNGYKILYDFLKCIDRGTLKIANIPFVFHVRESGGSKAGFAQGVALMKSFFS